MDLTERQQRTKERAYQLAEKTKYLHTTNLVNVLEQANILAYQIQPDFETISKEERAQLDESVNVLQENCINLKAKLQRLISSRANSQTNTEYNAPLEKKNDRC